ncbi:MAG: sensor histidine kinase [Paenibacillaceae bacterium]|nr:sensor histidine kinase [Paenibacillaceae bacterium]
MKPHRRRFPASFARYLGKLSYRHKVMFVTIGFAVIPIVALSFFIIWTAIDSYNDKFRQDAARQLDATVKELDQFYFYNVKKVNYIINNRFLKEILATNRNDPLLDIVTNYQIVADLFGVLEADAPGTQISVYTNNEFMFYGPFVNPVRMLDESARRRLVSLRENEIAFGSDAASMNIYSKVDSLNAIYGIVRISIPLNRLTDLLAQNMTGRSFLAYLPHDGGTPVWATAKEMAARSAAQAYEEVGQRRQTADYLVTEAVSTISGDRLALFLSKATIKQRTLAYSWISLLVLVLIVTAIVLTIRMVSFSLTKKLAHLVEHVRVAHPLLQNANDEAETRNNEFTLIEQKFIELVHQVQDDYKQISDYEVKKRLLEVEVLQANINPHFLYNTLSTIRWTFPDRNLSRVIDSLVKYYRIVLSKGNTVLRIGEEIQMNRDYIDIQKFAYQSDFSCEIVVDERIEACYTLKNILQPIVENAILHGINGRSGGGVLRIAASEDNDRVVMTVEDNGVGMERDKLARLLEFKAEQADGIHSGYGIRNVHDRIRAYFGPDYGVGIESEWEKGTKVTITLPKLPHKPA